MLRKNRFRTFVWYSGASLLVLFAVIVTLFRLYIASADEYRVQLEAIAGLYLGQPVTISGMDARVVGISPTAILSDVVLIQKDGRGVLSRFDSVSISLKPLASLWQRTPIIALTVSGANLEITRKHDGTLGVEGLDLKPVEGQLEEAPGKTLTTLEKSRALGGWFLSQSHLALRDSRITLHDEQSGERFSFNNVELDLRNSAERHRLNGFIHLPKSIGRELRVIADIEGDLLQDKEWKGSLYVKAVQIQSQQWLQQLSWQGSAIRGGMVNLESWSQWRGGTLASLRTQLQAQGVVLARGEQSITLPTLAADAQLRRQGGGWQLQVADLQIQHGVTPAPATRLTLSRDDSGTSLQFDQLQLETVTALLPYLPQLDERSRTMLQKMSPTGLLKAVHLQYAANQRLVLQGGLEGVAVSAWEKLPGITNLDAGFRLDGDNGMLLLGGSDLQLTLPRLFRAPLTLSRFNAGISLQREGQGWRVISDDIQIANSNLSAELMMELQLSQGSAPWLALQGRFQAKDVTDVPHYLPAGIMKPKSLSWLDNAFKAGRVPRGSMQYQGFVNQFPFHEQQGRFEVLFDAEAVQLHYQDGWPEFHQLSGQVRFDGPGMWIAAREARVYDASLGKTAVSITNFRAPQLLIDGGARFAVNDGLRFLRNSPLVKNTGQVLDGMQGSGPVTLALQLAIPLSDRVRQSRPLNVKGRVDFSANRLQVVDGVVLQELRGTLNFTENSFSAERIDAQLYNRPASISVMSEQGERPRVVVAARGEAELGALREAFKLPLLDYLQGSGEWQASLSLPRGGTGEGVVLRLLSDLSGVSSTMPEPLVKGAASQRQLELIFHLSGVRSGERRLLVDNGVGVVWRQEREGQPLRRLQLRLGGEQPLKLPSHDVIEVIGDGGRLNLSRWLDVLRGVRDDSKGAGPVSPLHLRLQQLHLLSNEEPSAERGEWKAAGIPDMDLQVADFAYDDMQLGSVALQSQSHDEQVSFKMFKVNSDIFVITGEGAWNEGGNTFFSFNLNSSNLGGMMKRLGFASVIEQGKAMASGKLWWAGAPTDVSLAGLNGQLRVKIQDGTMVDVEPGAGRLLGILSIPALPRRLFLDFRDLFTEGLAFSSINGDIRIEQGEAYTSNLKLESVPASILVTGRTGLVMQDFEQDLYVVPNVRDTVSIASALAWGPQVAAVVALLQQIFKSDISAATMSQYHISGSWLNPQIEQIRKGEDLQPEPPFAE